jgi:ABC-type uncharacterized transport system substrate-binding protein
MVFAIAVDPVGTGMVASLAKPGGNVTGLSTQTTELAGKRLEVLRELFPDLRRMAVNGGLIVTASALAAVHRELIIALAAHHKLPAIYRSVARPCWR